MPEASLVVTAQDRYSEAIRKMRTTTQAFNKDVDALEKNLTELSHNKATLKLDADDALRELRESERQFRATGDAADLLQVQTAQANYDGIRRNLNAVTRAAREAERQFIQTGSSGRSAAAGIGTILSSIAAAGVGNMLSGIVQEGASILAGSALGSSGGSLISSALSMGIQGAAIGSIIPGIGTALGTVIGAGAGLVSGGLSIYSSQDEAFKSYVQEAVEGQISSMESTLSSGSAIAGSREQTRLAFAQRLGSDQAADEYLERVRVMAMDTNYSYDEITGYSKSLLNTYDPESVFGILQTLSDATAGLNLNEADVNVMIQGLSRMRTTGKATQEYLNYFSERGVDVYAALADATGADKSQIAGMVTDGDISGETAAQAILDYINTTFGGLSEKLATTYDAMVDNLADAQAEIDAAMGEGYNEARKEGLQAQQDWLNGESGEKVSEAYSAIGAFQAELENQKEALERQFVDEAMGSTEYQAAEAAGDAATMGRLIMEAKVRAQNEYNASEGAQLLKDSEIDLIDSVREDSKVSDAYWDAGYQMGLAFSRGRADGMLGGDQASLAEQEAAYALRAAEAAKESAETGFGSSGDVAPGILEYSYAWQEANGYATGLERVPYDNFPALLHEGERVLTAGQARSVDAAGSGPSVQIVLNGVTIREDADIDRLAEVFLERMRLAGLGGALS